jgi:hypothetical protein
VASVELAELELTELIVGVGFDGLVEGFDGDGLDSLTKSNFDSSLAPKEISCGGRGGFF